MRLPFLALCLAASAAAQPAAVDVSLSGGVMVAGPGEVLISGVAPTVAVALVATPAAVGNWFRGVASAAFTPGTGRDGDGEVVAVGFGVEVPLAGRRNGVYLALGAALVDVQNTAHDTCTPEVGCMGGGIGSYLGPAWTGGLGARVAVGRRVWVEPSVSALVWGDVLPSARVGVGWQLR